MLHFYAQRFINNGKTGQLLLIDHCRMSAVRVCHFRELGATTLDGESTPELKQNHLVVFFYVMNTFAND